MLAQHVYSGCMQFFPTITSGMMSSMLCTIELSFSNHVCAWAYYWYTEKMFRKTFNCPHSYMGVSSKTTEHPGVQQKADWTWSWASCSRYSFLNRGVEPDALQRSFPISTVPWFCEDATWLKEKKIRINTDLLLTFFLLLVEIFVLLCSKRKSLSIL